MESTNNYELIAITKKIIDQTENVSFKLNIEMILQVIDQIETLTGCTLYNKDNLTNYFFELSELSEEDFYIKAKKALCKNLIPQIDFNVLFSSNMNFELIFKEDDIVVLYKNNPITIDCLVQIKCEIIKDNEKSFPPIADLYINNIINVISKFINKDISVQYYCKNIHLLYWKLFEIKCKKTNSTSTIIHDQCQELTKIITGHYFINVQDIKQLDTQDDYELKMVLEEIKEFENKKPDANLLNNLSDNEKKELEELYRIEVLPYLYDNQVTHYLNTLEQIDIFEKDNNYIIDIVITNKYKKFLIDSINSIENKIAKFYYLYKICFLINFANTNNTINKYIEDNDNERYEISNIINKLNNELDILQSADVKLYHAVVKSINESIIIIDTINKKKIPNYIPVWTNNNVTNPNLYTNPILYTNYNNISDNDNGNDNDDDNDDDNDNDDDVIDYDNE